MTHGIAAQNPIAGDAVGIFFLVLLVWTPAVWIYLDAAERGLSSFVWGTLALVPVWNVAVLVFYFRHRARVEPPAEVAYSRARIYEHVAAVTFYVLVVVALLAALFGVISYIRAEDPPLQLQEPRGDVLRETLARVVALLVISIPALAAHLTLVRRRLARALTERHESIPLAKLQGASFSLIVVLSGLVAAYSAVLLVFEVVGRAFDVGGVGRDASTFGMSGLPISLLSLAIAYAVFWMSERFQQDRRLLRASATEASPPASGEG